MNARITGTAVSPWPMRLRSSRASLRSPALRPPRFRFLRSSVATGKPSSLPAPAFYILYISSLILCNFPLSSLQDSLFLSDRKSRNDTREFRASIDDGFIYFNYNSSATVSSVIDILRRFTHPLSSYCVTKIPGQRVLDKSTNDFNHFLFLLRNFLVVNCHIRISIRKLFS